MPRAGLYGSCHVARAAQRGLTWALGGKGLLMSNTGVHFAITQEEAERLMGEPGVDDDYLEGILSEIEEQWDEQWLQETDKAWDAIHRCLTDGSLLYGDDPLEMCILAHDNLFVDESQTLCFIEPSEVTEVANAISAIGRDEMRRRYNLIDSDDYGRGLSDIDFDYTWDWFVPLQAFFRKAAESGRAVGFTVR